ncbi:MAG: hypothetical protein KGY70_18730, partial [Bacteroidales bacterium]|nr:hypothetical protein [Bacteroidales bacterium]
MKTKKYRINGRVIDQTGKGVEGLRVEAWDKDLIFNDFLGSAETDSNGRFDIEFDESHFREIFLDRRPDLFFKVFDHDELIINTKDSVLWNFEKGEKEIEIRVDIPAPDQIFRVKGIICEQDGSPVAGATVKAFDKNIKSETFLGETTTGKAGRYEIAYAAEKFIRSGKRQPDLIVRASYPNGEELASTKQPFYNAGKIQEVNLIAGHEKYKGPSEYKQCLKTLTPLLKDNELSELTAEEVDFLAGKTGIDSRQIKQLVLAARFAEKSGLPAEVFYGMLRQNLPASLPGLLAQNPDIQKSSLEAAVRDNLIPATIPVEQVLERFQEMVIDHAFEPLEPLPTGKTTLGELLGTVQMNQEMQRDFLNIYVNHQGSVEEFWSSLEQTDLEPHVQELQYTLQLGVLTGNHLPLVQHLKQLESISCLRDLAGLDVDNWKEMVQAHGLPPDVPGKDDEEKADNYARTIFRMVQDAFPTTVVGHKLRREEEFVLPFQETISDFFIDTPEFELGTTQIDTYLRENPDVFSEAEDREGLIRELKTLDRLFRISPRFERYETIKVLKQNGFNSAQSIAMMGQSSFCTQFADAEKLGNYWKAKAIYNHALQMTSMALSIHSRHSAAFNQPGMYVLPNIIEKMQEIPEWDTLFGSFKLCDCEHCKSVYSPSAYLVDLLAFLQNHNLKKENDTFPEVKSAFGILSERRPDIERIELSCKNANTLVPYVDLVNEILENGVSYNSASYQTEGTANELSANPAHLNVEAYEKLAEAVYPWSLPFDLWTEEARTYLNHLGVSRYKLLETFRKNGKTPEPDDYTIAGEYFGMTSTGWQIIAGTTSHDNREFWGMSEIDWVDELSRVPVFLEKSGLTYKELDELLNTRFINPGRFSDPYDPETDISINFPDAFCNIDEAEIENLEEMALNRIHRFVRLLRKIGWTARELDIAINILKTPHLDDPEIDEPLLLKLCHLNRLHNEFKVPVVELLSFWSLINTEDYNGQVKPLYDQLFLNKTVLNPEDKIFELNDQRNEL